MTSDFGSRLKEERKRLSMTQEEFAAMGGVGRSAQIKYESGERRPDADYLAKVAAVLDVQYLLTGQRLAASGVVGEERQSYQARRYSKPEEALMVVVEVQNELGLSFTATQIKSILGYAYTAQVSHEQIKLFVEQAFELFGEKENEDDPD